MKKMLFFVNPTAGHAEIRSHLMEILQIFTEGGYAVTVHPTAAPKDLTKRIVEQAEEFDLIVCTGGDGTLNEAVSGLMLLPAEKRPPLGYIPSGTTNDMAFTLGLSRDFLTAAGDIVNGEPFEIDVGAFCEDRSFAYVAAFGLFTDVSYDTPQQDKRVLGRLAYLFSGMRALGEVHPIHVRVTSEGMTQELDVLDGLVCSSTSVAGFHAIKDLEPSINDGEYEIVLVRDIKSLADFNAAAGCILRGELPEPYFLTFQADRVSFAFDEPVAWTLDGEYGGTETRVEIRNLQRAVRIIVPSKTE